MWAKVINEGSNLDWVVTALTNGTAISVTDGSYKKDIAPDVSGAGWVIHCTQSKLKLKGSFYERSPDTGSYRGELMGLTALHLMILALEQFYRIPAAKTKVCCDSEGALFKASESSKRVPTGSKHADLR